MTNRTELPLGADRLGLIETFVRIVEAGSLSAAAQRLGSSQPTVSRRLRALERELGVRLLQRSTHAMTLTDDGARCFERARQLLEDWQILHSEMRGAGEEPAGRLHVFVPHAFGQEQLIAPLAAYLRRYPRMTVEWRLQDRTPDFIAEGVDCALHVGEVQEPGVVAIHVGEVPRIVVAAPDLMPAGADHPEALRELPWLALSAFYRDEVALRRGGRGEPHRLPIRPRMVTDSLYALRSAALQGLGAAIASYWAVSEDIAAGRLRHLAPDWGADPLPVSIVYPPARFYPARLRRFIDVMREAFQQLNGVRPRLP